MKTYQVEQFEIIARPEFNRVLLPKVGPEFNLKDAQLFFGEAGTVMIRDQHSTLVFTNVSEKSLNYIRAAGGVSVMDPTLMSHPKLAHIPLHH